MEFSPIHLSIVVSNCWGHVWDSKVENGEDGHVISVRGATPQFGVAIFNDFHGVGCAEYVVQSGPISSAG